MNTTLKKALITTIEEWSKLDEVHKGKYYNEAVKNLENWLNEDGEKNDRRNI